MLHWVSNRSLGTKFAIMVVAVLVVTLGSANYLYVRAEYQLLLDSLSAKGESLGRFVSLISPQSVLSYDFEGMNDFMREITHEDDVVYGVLVASNGVNLSHYLDFRNHYVAEAKSHVADGNVLKIIEAINGNPDILRLEFPVRFDGQSIASLMLGMDRSRIEAHFREVLTQMLLANVAIIVFLSVCIYVGFRYMAMKPILSLRSGLRRVADGDLQSDVPVLAEDEIGGLTRSFNDMVGRLKRTISEKDEYARQYHDKAEQLAALNADLEGRVQESARIMRDLHDDVGAKLLTLVHRSETDPNAQTARAALHNLRETIRGLGEQEAVVELADALSDWQAEAEDRLDAAGIELQWQQPEDLPERVLSNRQRINLSRILREALSNAIRHAEPHTVHIQTSLLNGSVRVLLCDDGTGVNPNDWAAGTGVTNMETRARELDATIHWYRASDAQDGSGGGTCVEIRCPLVNGG